jgi:hypothetical protein
MIFRIRYTKVWYENGINRLKEFEVYTFALRIENGAIVTDSKTITLEMVTELYIDLIA